MATSWAIRIRFPRSGSFFSLFCTICTLDRDSAVGIAVRYRWTARGSNPGRGEIFRTRPDRHWGPPTLLYNGYRVFFPGRKAAGEWCWPPTPSSVEVKERVELYLLSPLWAFMAFSRVTFTSFFRLRTRSGISSISSPVWACARRFYQKCSCRAWSWFHCQSLPRVSMLRAVGPTSIPPIRLHCVTPLPLASRSTSFVFKHRGDCVTASALINLRNKQRWCY